MCLPTFTRWLLAFLLAITAWGCGKTAAESSFEKTTGLRDKVIANPKDESSVRKIVGLLDHNYALTRANAAACLRQLGADPATREHVAPIAVPALASRIDSVGREAPNALKVYGPFAVAAVPQLIRAVEQYPTQDTGWFAAEALGNIGPAAKDKKWIGCRREAGFARYRCDQMPHRFTL